MVWEGLISLLEDYCSGHTNLMFHSWILRLESSLITSIIHVWARFCSDVFTRVPKSQAK